MDAAVSILVPVHNAAPYLASALDSVRAQTFTDWRCVCVDDGSTDASPAILARFAAADARFTVITQPNRGVAAARNVLLDHATGDWVFFLDADDVLAPRALELLVSFQRVSDAELVWAQYRRFRSEVEPNVRTPTKERDVAVRVFAEKEWRALCAHRYSLTHDAADPRAYAEDVPCQPWNKLISRRLLDGLSFAEDLTRGEDLVFFAHVFARVDRVVVLDPVTYFYRFSAQSLYRTGGDYAGLHDYARAVCRFAAEDAARSAPLGDYVARRWVLSWLRAVVRWADLGRHAAARELFLADCRQLCAAFGTRLPVLSRLALRLTALFYRVGFD